MKKEIENWLKIAKEDLDSARFNFDGGKYKVSTFLCQQAVEKAFKALLLKKTGKIRKIHDLVILGKSINAPDNIINNLKELTMAYTYSRYPDIEEVPDLRNKSSSFLGVAAEALKWVEKNL